MPLNDNHYTLRMDKVQDQKNSDIIDKMLINYKDNNVDEGKSSKDTKRHTNLSNSNETNKLNQKELLKVIQMADLKYSNKELSKMFNRSYSEIFEIVSQRESILLSHEYSSRYDSEKRQQILKAFENGQKSHQELAFLFNCSRNFVTTTLLLIDRPNIILDKKSHVEEIKLSTDNKIHCVKYSKIFQCSCKQVGDILKNHEFCPKDNKREIPKIGDYCQQKTYRINNGDTLYRIKNLNLAQRIEILKGYDKNYTKRMLAHKFNCTSFAIEAIINSRDQVIEEYEKWYRTKLSWQVPLSPLDDIQLSLISSKLKSTDGFILSLDDCIEVLRAYNRHNFSFFKLSSIFDYYTDKQIQFCIVNREGLLKKYKDLHPELDENEVIRSDNNKLSMECKHLEAVNRKNVNIFKKLRPIHDYVDVFNALQPIQGYAKVKKNRKALHVLQQFDNYLEELALTPTSMKASSKNDSKAEENTNESVDHFVETLQIYSYKDALTALGPVLDYAELKNNMNAVHISFHLEEHLTAIKSREKNFE